MPESEQEKAERLARLDRAVRQLEGAKQMQRIFDELTPEKQEHLIGVYTDIYNEMEEMKRKEANV